MACFPKRSGEERRIAGAEDSGPTDPARRYAIGRGTHPPFSRGAGPTAGRQTAAGRGAAINSARNRLTRAAARPITVASTNYRSSSAAGRHGVERGTAPNPGPNRATKIQTGDRQRSDLRNSRARRSGGSGIGFAPRGCFARRPIKSPGPARNEASVTGRDCFARNFRTAAQFTSARNDQRILVCAGPARYR